IDLLGGETVRHITSPDQRAFHIAISLDRVIGEIEAGNLDSAKTAAFEARHEASLLCNDLDPLNERGISAPLYAALLRPERLADLYGTNVIALKIPSRKASS